MQIRVETGPIGDHEPEMFHLDDHFECFIMVDPNRRLGIMSGNCVQPRTLAVFDGDDWTSVTIDQSMDPI